MVKCPMSEFAVQNLRNLADAYDTLTRTAITLADRDEVSDRQKQRAFRRAERTGRVIDSLLLNWELQNCSAVCHSCSWEQCERELAIISALTPCSQFFTPLFQSNGSGD
ncbi:MAG: hypothetical protein IJB55_01465 [Firmicutes bacterium]|nr:hypothetical protein [Bacillota bacterium]